MLKLLKTALAVINFYVIELKFKKGGTAPHN